MKTIVLLISLIFLAFTGTQSDVTIQADYKTDEADANKIHVSVSVVKGNLSEFGRYIHGLPSGFSAESSDNNFTFEDGKVKYIWINLPAEVSFSFSYTIIVPEGYSGALEMDGTFAYVMNNQRMQAQIKQDAVALSPDSPVEYTAPKEPVALASEQPFEVNSMRKLIDENGGYKVFVKVKKDRLNEMAKITENIPEGYSLKMDENYGGIHTFADNKLNIMWMEAPSEESFIISYELVPVSESGEKPVITGEFSYAYKGVTYSTSVTNGNFSLPQEQRIVNSTMMMQPKKVVAAMPKETSVNNLSEGLLFRVQIAASHQKVNAESYFKRYNIYEPVFMHEHEGWQKYLVGNFESYRQASKHKKEVWNSTPIKDAFVAAYNNGTRITVQEALMIMNQAVL